MTGQANIIKYVSLVFAITYVVLGAGVLWKHTQLSNILNGYAIPFGILLILYGLFRGYRAFQKYY